MLVVLVGVPWRAFLPLLSPYTTVQPGCGRNPAPLPALSPAVALSGGAEGHEQDPEIGREPRPGDSGGGARSPISR